MRPALRIDGVAWAALSALLCVGAVVVTAISGAGGAALASAPLAQMLDWQPASGLREPWRLWTCAWVHWSPAHLLANAAGALVVAFVGWRARLPASATLAWFIAWPLTQLAMAALGSDRIAAAMPHYGGLSGVLHAGVVVLGLSLAWPVLQARARSPAAPSRTGRSFFATREPAIEPSRFTEGPWAMTEMGAPTALPVSTLDQPVAAAAHADVQRPLRERWIGVAIVAGTFAKVVFEAPWDFAPRPSAALGMSVAPVAHACGVAAGLLAWAGVRMLGRRGR